MLPLGLSVFALLSLLMGFGGIYLALVPGFPVSWLYVHAKTRKLVNWGLLVGAIAWIVVVAQGGALPDPLSLGAIGVLGLGVLLAHRLHQDAVFQALTDPAMAQDPLTLPLDPEHQLALIEVDGVTRAYPLEYVIHHHVINDHIGRRLIALTYCAMCRTIIAFDVTEIGPLYVGSFKDANMIVADRRTGTFFQQATFESLIGPLHPARLTLTHYQVLPWSAVRQLRPMPQVVHVTSADLRDFELPIPGLWRRIMAGDVTPGLARRRHDPRFSPRTRVIALAGRGGQVVAIPKTEVLDAGVVELPAYDVVLVAHGQSVNGFHRRSVGQALQIDPAGALHDALSGTTWDPRGKYSSGPRASDLEPIVLSDEFWFAWRFFHPDGQVIRISSLPPVSDIPEKGAIIAAHTERKGR